MDSWKKKHLKIIHGNIFRDNSQRSSKPHQQPKPASHTSFKVKLNEINTQKKKKKLRRRKILNKREHINNYSLWNYAAYSNAIFFFNEYSSGIIFRQQIDPSTNQSIKVAFEKVSRDTFTSLYSMKAITFRVLKESNFDCYLIYVIYRSVFLSAALA